MRRWCWLWVVCLASSASASDLLRIGVAETDITPPPGLPIAGYYHERLATGTKDPLKAKAIVFQQGDVSAAWVVCDLTGIAIDLSTEVRRRAAQRTGLPAANIVVSATHSHTAPDYSRALYDHLTGPAAEASETVRSRADYAGQLIERVADAVVKAHAAVQPARVRCGSVTQHTPVSYCRRFLMRDGSVRTWVGLKHPDAVRPAGPIDPEIGLVQLLDAETQRPRALVSNFALHLDTVGGLEWSGDYPYFIEQAVQRALGKNVLSLFGTGCCGDINHSDPAGQQRRKADAIGAALGHTICEGLPALQPIGKPWLQVHSTTVPLRLRDVSPAEVRQAIQQLSAVQAGNKIDFFDHVAAYRNLMLDNLRQHEPATEALRFLSWGLTRTWRGIGDTLPAEVTVISLGHDLAVVFLPGEVFVELGLAIKQASPFRTTLVVELSHCVETVYIPTRAAYVGGGYEPTNSAVQPGSGELLVEAAVQLLRQSATTALLPDKQ